MGADRDRIEQKSERFHEQVREGYRELAEAEPRRIKFVDASGTPEQVHAQVRRLVDEILPRR
jgi:dTMP kinase